MWVGLNYWVQIVINEEMVHILDVEMVKSLSLVSRFISKAVKRFIEDNSYFYAREKWFMFYEPKNISHVTSISHINSSVRKVMFSDRFDECIDLSIFTHLTRIEYGAYFNKSINNRYVFC
eukprot:TRINITY_DN5734_c0_g2_i1.p2 TRINITY_DN5734_c0_g2~~TRINITY_DN5734_c0_g2_i1.p2  ORF type:complete len:120 (+),score=13.74 TRINITY_DN5734_c0_g2_i1:515-874(+)